MTESCDHDKLYAPYVMASNPPQFPWVCRKYRERGVDRGAYRDAGAEYERLIRGGDSA